MLAPVLGLIFLRFAEERFATTPNWPPHLLACRVLSRKRPAAIVIIR